MSDATVEKWGVFEASFEGPAGGNPYLDVAFDAVFTHKSREVRVPGFYDGNGTYRIRFMPDTEGEWSFRTRSRTSALDGKTGALMATAPSSGNHGPVRVRNKFHFAYADGTPFLSFGTTCYAWTHQPPEMQKQTLETLEKARFNKMRMGVFPKDYPYNVNEPLHACFERGADGKEDFNRPNPAAFQHFEKRVAALCDLGIEADIIIFHPYDRWGYADMSAEQDFRYVEYLAARLAAYRNVWWSLANEYDFLIDTKPMEQWDRYFHILEENDPYQHLRSIHNGDVTANFDHRKPWITHTCIQNPDVKRTQEWRDAYGKPVVNDEPEYEGDILQSWGNLHPRELVHRFWITMARGGYAGHGETYSHPEDLIWWAKGGELRGEAWKRIGFLRDLLEADVKHGLEPLGIIGEWPWSRVSGARDGDGDFRLIYFGEHQPVIWSTGLPVDGDDYDVDIIDTWEMTITPAEKVAAPVPHPTRHGSVVRGGKPDAAFGVKIPRKPHQALRVRRKR
ncbi:DUF5060 domain-containing protein [Rhizobium sp. NLR10a]|uniref:DUF5060 domain-containing protein n=1 Tax=unclassified Rhizobium TaxID=2613769 RepID=UPI001C82A80F|nr:MULTISPECIES: DUF5060 domain-containing protein [unclassified Rhizobium]MBX5214021.1 DUF5060 domain-containing protein [Rhizobium sp. NLR9a]MBX5219237.1 DUF5060 domain-containing protein [Rhizobium sp. NLR8a]MBX5274998.1 DUF5060 domain-containing protein [Rhizobium sp. NLR13a]MBX5281197.1 DUF5060 domain-containing protein [Rhizobium sp. NLR10a]MBX5294770.1 DUF5060 domain-containing protein [Rhizobium sp. NLR15a]